MKIEIWSDIACPWCFIGKRRFETALEGFEYKDQIDVEWRSYQLDPTLPEHYDGTETEYLSRMKGMPEDQVKQMFGHVTAQAAGEGLNYDFDKVVVANSFTAHRFLHLAKEHGLMDQAKEAPALLAISSRAKYIWRRVDIWCEHAASGTCFSTKRMGPRRTLAGGDRFAEEVRAELPRPRAGWASTGCRSLCWTASTGSPARSRPRRSRRRSGRRVERAQPADRAAAVGERATSGVRPGWLQLK